jgi:hypothetical protein
MSQNLLSSILGSVVNVVGSSSFDKEIEKVTSNENNINGQINYGTLPAACWADNWLLIRHATLSHTLTSHHPCKQ